MNFTRTEWRSVVATAITLSLSSAALADGIVVDRIYDPYVEAGETEIEWRATRLRDSDDETPNLEELGGEEFGEEELEEEPLDGLHRHRLGMGYGFSERWFGEVYLIGEGSHEESLNLKAVELEAKWQITEQGEYSADWGMLFELERETEVDMWETAVTLISSREWGRWTGTANLEAIYEWGEEEDELESELKLQGRYRWKPELEPALEFYAGQDTVGLGPVLLGDVKFGQGRRLRWEFGVIVGVTDESPDQSFRFLVEYEFFN
ncbi:hypothetical protein [Microbulbifer aggregans]|uniref:hypothetical protein n=1 Tax=Microbulbifer aggregans TaxID=1769779 RepID=UPI001CFC7B3B|nr:hypothetical protein [Microbulbifer aggregans]